MAITCTVQLLDWSETKRGQKVVLEIMGDADDLPFEEHPFKVYTTREGKKAGQLFGCVFVQVDENGDASEPVKPKDQKRSQLAFLMCRDETFWEFINVEVARRPICTSEQNCIGYLYDFFGIESRAELDSLVPASAAFDQLAQDFEAYRNSVYRARIR